MSTSRTYARTSSPVDTAPLERESPLRVTAEPPTTTLPAPIYEPAIPDPTVPPAPVSHRLPAHRNKVERVTDHLAGLSEDLREWVELRIQLIRKEIEEKIEGRLSSVKGLAIVGALAAVTALFGLVTLAIGIGAATGHYWIGFLSVFVVLVLFTWLAKRKFAPGAIRVEHEKATGKLKIAHEETPAEHETKTATSSPDALPVD